MKEITFITGNQNKADFLAKHLGVPVLHQALDLTEIQGALHDIVISKAEEAYGAVKGPVLVEDASLAFPASSNWPGPYIKHYLKERGIAGLIREAYSLPDQSALGRVCYGLHDGTEVHLFDGEMRGRIARAPGSGGRGFGFDSVFINEGFDVPRSDMSEEDYDRTSHRMLAIQSLRDFLTNPT